MKGFDTIIRWFLCLMTVFILQKLYFLIYTCQESIAYADVLDVVWHGLKLDTAVAAYLLVLPWLMVMFIPMLIPKRCVENRAAFVVKYETFMKHFLRIYFFVTVILLAIIFVADTSLYPFWNFKLDASIFLYADKPKDALASVSVGYIIHRLLWIMIWIWLQWRIATIVFKKFTQGGQTLLCKFARKKANPASSRICAIALSIMVAAALVLMIRGGVGQGTNNVSAAYYSDNQYLNHAAVNPVFNLIYSMGKQERFGDEYQFFEERERSEAMAWIYHTQSVGVDTLLNTQRPDILLIVWEGCSERVADCIGGKTGVTPCLSDIAREGILFSNCYANSYRTDRGLVCLMAGWLGLPDASLMKLPQKAEQLPALPRTLLDNGYATTFWYGGDISFTNMGGYMHQAGFHRTVSDKDFKASELTTDWGAPDGTLLKKVAEKIKGKSWLADMRKPSFDAIMTLSSHEPWDVPTNVLKDERENAFNYADKCIGELISSLKASPRWKNLLVIITADHGAMYPDSKRYDNEIIHIPMVWTGGAVKEPRVVSQLMNQSDLAATLLGQMGIEHNDFIFSRDVMSRAYKYPTATFCYNNGVLFRDSTGVTIFDNDANRVIYGEDKLRERKAKATLQTLYKVVDGL